MGRIQCACCGANLEDKFATWKMDTTTVWFENRSLRGGYFGTTVPETTEPHQVVGIRRGFYRLLKQVQTTTSLIDKTMDVDSCYGILRSIRRGMTAHTRNMGVTKDALKTFNRWSKEMNSCTGGSRLDMPDTYLALNAIKPMLFEITRIF